MDRNLNWKIQVLPEDCKNIFICVDEGLFDEKNKARHDSSA